MVIVLFGESQESQVVGKKTAGFYGFFQINGHGDMVVG